MKQGSRNDHRLDFAVTIAIAREEKGLTQTQMGASVGCSQTVYNHFERGISFPKHEHQVECIADDLGLDRARLVRLWQKSQEDCEKLGPPLVTRAYDIKAGTRSKYQPKKRK